MLGSLIGAVAGPLISGIFGRNEARSANGMSMEQMQLDREYQNRVRKTERTWFNRDLAKQKQYAKQLTADDRQHAHSVLQDERRYQENKARQERDYARKVLLDERDYAAGITAGDRRYAEKTRRQDRMYLDRRRDQDIAQYEADRERMQTRSNKLARWTADSRGIDFKKLRDDAIAAGYNPMTALSMAHAYSTQVDYQLQGGVYSPGANYTTSGPGYIASSTAAAGGGGGAGGGGVVTPGAVVGSHAPAAGNFQASGAGYQSNFQPKMASGAFIQEAIDRAVDTGFNRPKENDPLADALRGALKRKRTVQSVQDENFSQDFGYDLTKQEAFKPTLSVGVPPLRNDQNQVLQPAKAVRPPKNPARREYIPVVNPDGQRGKLDKSVARRLDIQPWDTLSPGDWTELVGEVGEIESALMQDKIRENVLDAGLFGPSVDTSIRDYLESGTTGNLIMRSDPNAGWMDQFFQ